jgi:transcriptional regulator with XRE-family HTH domain
LFTFLLFEIQFTSGGVLMKETKILLGERLRELRKSRGLTQEQFAEMIEVEQKHVSRLELGKSFPTLERLEKISQALKVPLRDIFDFVHLADRETRSTSIEEMMKKLDEENQKIAYKVFNGIVRSLQD